MEGQSIKSTETRSYLASHQRGEPTAFWRSSLLSGVNFFKASFTAAHVFSRHTHDEYAIAVVERGAPAFTCRGAARVAPPGSFLLINPDQHHAGRSANDRSYLMMYVEPNAFALLLDHDSPGVRSPHLPLFRSPVVEDPSLATEYLRLHRPLEPNSLHALQPH